MDNVFIRAEIMGENAGGQKHIHLLASNADGIHFWTDDKSIIRSIDGGHMTNKEWIDLLSKEFNVSRTSARDMLHALMTIKRYDNFKRSFDPLPEPNKEGES